MILALLGLWLPQVVAGQAYEETGKKHSWFSFSKPAKKTPAEQMEHAQGLLRERKLKKAGKAFRSLAITWPSSPEAPLAQWAYARILDQRGKREDAFDAYQDLMDKHAGRFPQYDSVLARQFELAKEIMNKRRGTLLFGGFEAPERAIPYLEKVVKNGPRSPHAAEAQYLIGEANERSYQYELAVVSYIATLHRFPFSEFAEPAAFGRARSLYALVKNHPNDQRTLEEAWAGIMVFLRSYPNSEFTEEAVKIRDDLLERRARAAYDIAVYYDRIAKRPLAARESYELFVRNYPNSRWTQAAKDRISELAAKLPADEDTPENE